MTDLESNPGGVHYCTHVCILERFNLEELVKLARNALVRSKLQYERHSQYGTPCQLWFWN
jgi:hypothetical protein